MVFNDSTLKIQTRVRSVFSRLRPSKSTTALSSLFKSQPVPPLPPPLFSHQATIEINKTRTLGEFLDAQLTASVMLKRSDKKLTKRAAGFKSLINDNHHDTQTSLGSMLEQQVLSDSPLSFHITSLVAKSSDSIDSSSSASSSSPTTATTRRRSSSDSAYLSHLFHKSPIAGTTRPVVLNTVERSTPELCGTSHLNMVQPQSCIPQTSPTPSEPIQELVKDILHTSLSSSSPPSSDLTNNKNQTKQSVFHSPDPSLSARKLTASPVQCYLKRPGLIPSTQPISDKLLQSFTYSNHNVINLKNTRSTSASSASSFGNQQDISDQQEDVSMATITPRSLGLIYNNHDDGQSHLSDIPTIEINLVC